MENEQMLARESVEVDGVIDIPGAGALLRSLADTPHAIVTSANVALMQARMSAAGLNVHELRVTAEHVSKNKPDPEGFLLAAAALGIDLADCIAFEDSEAGIQAGLAAGMRVVGVGRLASVHGPTHHVDDLTQVEITATDDRLCIRVG